MKFIERILVLLFLVALAGCASVRDHRNALNDSQGERVTVGTVQKEIRVGMASSEVAASLGSPNIVTTDENRREVWIYDKLSTEKAYSTSSGGISTLFLGLGGAVGGGFGSGYNSSAGAGSTSQKTLTVIIKFDEKNLVRDFAYHTSRF